MTDTTTAVIGYASLANVPYQVVDSLGPFVEVVADGAFPKALLDRCDCRFLYDHRGTALARNRAGTLDLKGDALGLYTEARLDGRVTASRDVLVAIERGDVTQMSFGFVVERDTWSKDFTRRTIHEIGDLLDVSAVTYPASPSTWIRLKDAVSEAKSRAMRRAAVELEWVAIRRRSSGETTETRSTHMTAEERRDRLAERREARLTAEERAEVRKAGEKRKKALDGGNETYRQVFGHGDEGSERR